MTSSRNYLSVREGISQDFGDGVLGADTKIPLGVRGAELTPLARTALCWHCTRGNPAPAQPWEGSFRVTQSPDFCMKVAMATGLQRLNI